MAISGRETCKTLLKFGSWIFKHGLCQPISPNHFQRCRLLCTQIPKGVIFDKKPVKLEVVEGKVYKWCTCGRSKKQPFCDGTHKFDPVTGEKLVQPTHKSLKYEAEKTKTVFFCNCKQTNKRPFCDGTHKEL